MKFFTKNFLKISPQRKIVVFCYAILPVSVLVVFQNCGQQYLSTNTASLLSIESGDLIVSDPELDDNEDNPLIRKVQVTQMVANRILTANYFKDIFGKDIENTVTTLIADQAEDFGSGHTIYDKMVTEDCATKKNINSPCSKSLSLKLTALSSVGTNIRREAFRVRSCHTAVKYRTLNALLKIDPAAKMTYIPPINEENLKKAFHLFFRARPSPSPEVLEALLIVSQKSAVPIDKWKTVFLTICLSPHWQVL